MPKLRFGEEVEVDECVLKDQDINNCYSEARLQGLKLLKTPRDAKVLAEGATNEAETGHLDERRNGLLKPEHMKACVPQSFVAGQSKWKRRTSGLNVKFA
ncbi:unnamed protein product [Peronospora belbahrii]|uniref:Uncharacterized protein n=1 Tax=Peronospora belbahrii TaxID=622444 RepID=A0ABN8DB25_9STRA|nr:unnamed protein product [Peronospora belbahrii]